MEFEQLPKEEQNIIDTFDLTNLNFPKSYLLELLDCLDEDLKTIETEQNKPQEIIDYMKKWSKYKREEINLK